MPVVEEIPDAGTSTVSFSKDGSYLSTSINAIIHENKWFSVKTVHSGEWSVLPSGLYESTTEAKHNAPVFDKTIPLAALALIIVEFYVEYDLDDLEKPLAKYYKLDWQGENAFCYREASIETNMEAHKNTYYCCSRSGGNNLESPQSIQ